MQSYFDIVLTKIIIINSTDGSKTNVNFFFKHYMVHPPLYGLEVHRKYIKCNECPIIKQTRK